MVACERVRAIRWELLEEHLDEGGFLSGLWEAALRAPNYTLPEIAAGPEERLLAHLDGLVLGGAEAAQKLAVPALGADDPGIAFTAALALLASEEGDFLPTVLGALEAATPQGRAPLLRALSVSPVAGLGARLVPLLGQRPAARLSLLEVLGALRVDPAERLEALASSRDPSEVRLGLHLGRVWPGRLEARSVAAALGSPDGGVRAEALTTALVLGIPSATAAAEVTVRERAPGWERAACLLGLSGDDASVTALAPLLAENGRAAAAALALGFSGRVSAADALLEAMREDELAPAAGEGFSAITGLVLEPPFSGRRPEPEDEDAPPPPDLPMPVAHRVSAWWKETRPKLDPAQRWLRGRRWSPEVFLQALELGPAHRREGWSLELAVRSRGRSHLGWDTFSARQHQEIAEARGTATQLNPRPFR